MATPTLDTPQADAALTEGDAYTANVRANFGDADVTDSLTFSISGQPAGSGLAIDAKTGRITGTPNADDVAAAPFTVTVTATDELGNQATRDIIFRDSSQPAPSPNVVRNRPGHYLKTQGDPSDPDTAAYQADIISKIDADMTDIPELQGALVAVSWGVLNPTGSTYDWSTLDAMIAAIEAHNGTHGHDYYCAVEIVAKNFRSDPNSLILPADLEASGYRATTFDNDGVTVLGYVAKLYLQPVLDRWLTFIEAFCDRYKDNTTIEIVTMHESTASWHGHQPSDWDKVAWAQSMKDTATTFSNKLPNTHRAINISSLAGELKGIFEHCYSVNCGFHSPDVGLATHHSIGERGEDLGSQGPGAPNFGDIRGHLYSGTVASKPALGGKDKVGNNAADVVNEAQQQQNSHLFWIPTSPTAGYTWPECKSAIQADPLLRTACPTRYAGCSS